MEIQELSIQQKTEYLAFLENWVSDNKKNLFEEVLQNRTKYLTVVLEDIFQPHNASAIVRSCDCFGVQDLHIIENKFKYTHNPDITLGSAQWVDMHKYNKPEENNTLRCLNELKSQGYKIVATTPHEKDTLVTDYKMDQKTALVFGTEKEGIRETVMQNADAFVKIPMYGFTESFNISVSAALCLFNLIEKLHKSSIDWALSETDKLEVKLRWAQSVVRNESIHRKTFFEKK